MFLNIATKLKTISLFTVSCMMRDVIIQPYVYLKKIPALIGYLETKHTKRSSKDDIHISLIKYSFKITNYTNIATMKT